MSSCARARRTSASGSPRPATSARTTRRSTARSRTRRSRRSRSASTRTTRAHGPRAISARSSFSGSRDARRDGRGLAVARGGLEAYGALVLRLVLGAIYVAHAYLALVVMGVGEAIAYQRAHHI